MKLVLLLALLSTTLALFPNHLKSVIKGIATSLNFKDKPDKLAECIGDESIESWDWFHEVLKEKNGDKKEDVLLRLSAFITPVVDTFIRIYGCSESSVQEVMEEIVIKSSYAEGLMQKFYEHIDKIKKNLNTINEEWEKKKFEEIGEAVGKIIKDIFYDESFDIDH